MTRVRLIHWKAEEAAERIATLKDAGYEVEYCVVDGEAYKELKNNPSAASRYCCADKETYGLPLPAIKRYHSERIRRIYLKPVYKSDGSFGVLRLVAALHFAAAVDRDSKALVWNEKRRQVARTP